MSGAPSDLEKALHGLIRVNRLVAELAGSDYARLIPRAVALKTQIKRAQAVVYGGCQFFVIGLVKE